VNELIKIRPFLPFALKNCPCISWIAPALGSYLLTSERTIERISMIENAIRKMRNHLVVLDSLFFVCLLFGDLLAISY